MNNKGFTLIELLAVIVILAIIALIATPTVLNIVDSSKKNSIEVSAKNYIDAVNQAVARRQLFGEFNPTECISLSNGNLKCVGYEDEVIVDLDGEKPSGVVFNFDRNVINAVSDFTMGGEQIEPTDLGLMKITVPVCKAVSVATNGNVPQGLYSSGDEYKCRVKSTMKEDFSDSYTFYVVSSDSSTVSLIMNSNIDKDGINNTKSAYVSWGSGNPDVRSEGPNIAMNELKIYTSSWDNIKLFEKTYTDYGYVDYTIESRARMAYSTELSSYCRYNTECSNWIKENVSGIKSDKNCIWLMNTSTISSYIVKLQIVNENNKYAVAGSQSTSLTKCGLRPVITISKSDIANN